MTEHESHAREHDLRSSAETSRAVGDPVERPVFVVGCPRSGTTWVQLLLAQHPDVVTSQETHLFSAYLGHLMRVWERERARPSDARRVGLTTVLEEERFRQACRGFADTVFQEVRARNPEAGVVVEKTPAHVRRADQIVELYPEAAFVHVIRDPRSVVCSLRSAARDWAGTWAPEDVVEGARVWCESVGAGLRIPRLTSRYHEVRYEALTRDAAVELGSMLGFLGLEGDRELCERAAEACRIDRLKERRGSAPWSLEEEPAGFFRQGRARGWEEQLAGRELRVIEHLAGDLMEELGYERAVPPRARRPPRLALREGLEWRLERVTARLRRWVRRL